MLGSAECPDSGTFTCLLLFCGRITQPARTVSGTKLGFEIGSAIANMVFLDSPPLTFFSNIILWSDKHFLPF